MIRVPYPKHLVKLGLLIVVESNKVGLDRNVLVPGQRGQKDFLKNSMKQENILKWIRQTFSCDSLGIRRVCVCVCVGSTAQTNYKVLLF